MHKHIFILSIGLTNFSFTQQKKYSIFLEEYNYYFTPQKEGCVDTLRFDDLDGDLKLKITLFDCNGKMHLECFRQGVKREEGNYINPFGLLRQYSKGVNGITGKRRISVLEYYQPVRTGEWFFYDKNGRPLNKKKYDNGIVN